MDILRFGVDVGGTNTDAVCIKVDAVGGSPEVLATCKATTTSDLFEGVERALKGCLAGLDHARYDVTAPKGFGVGSVAIGTTHFINAVVERSPKLGRVAVVRVASHTCDSVPPFTDFPASLRSVVSARPTSNVCVRGGYEFDGTEHEALSPEDIMLAAAAVKASDATGVAVSCPFSHVNPLHEIEVERALREDHGVSVPISMSHQVSTSADLLKRENATILNASLLRFSPHVVEGMRAAVSVVPGLRAASVYLTQNDGSLMEVADALRFPVKTFGSGATNSSRGAAFLALADPAGSDAVKQAVRARGAIVVDVGGTTSDVAVLSSGSLQPRQKLDNAVLGGVRTNFRMPDVLSVGLGGGSIVDVATGTVGPRSVGSRLSEIGVSFSEDAAARVVTATDVAARLRLLDPAKLSAHAAQRVDAAVPQALAEGVHGTMRATLQNAISQAKVSPEDVPLILVGGGAALFGTGFEGVVNPAVVPSHHSVANAVGAAISQVSYEYDRLVPLGSADDSVRAAAMQLAVDESTDAVRAMGGSADTVQIIRKEDIPLAYLQNNTTRIVVKVIADRLPSFEGLAQPAEAAAPFVVSPLAEDTVECADTGSDECAAVDYATLVPSMRNGEWLLSEADIDCVAVGAGVMGCGGGGDTYTSVLRAKAALRSGMEIRVVDTVGCPAAAIIVPCGFIGAPFVLLEKLSRGNEIVAAARRVCEAAAVTPTHIMSAEAGGANCIEPMLAAAVAGLPYLDCDGMGRAFPKVTQIMSYASGGAALSPAAMASDRGSVEVFTSSSTGDGDAAIEDFLRSACVKLGCIAGLALAPITQGVMAAHCVQRSVSQAWCIGQAVLAARQAKGNTVAALLSTQPAGRALFTGRVSDVVRRTEGGFTKGSVSLLSATGDAGSLDFQNEYLRFAVRGEAPSAHTPDLITVVEADTAQPIGTENIAFGQQVTVVVLPAPDLLKRKEALAVVGPQAFGFDGSFVSVGDRKEYSVWADI